jgi:FHS family L-fucose permease-like MFS transporter
MSQQKQSGNIVAIIMMIFLFGMIAFVTNLAAPMGIVLKNQFGVSNFMGLLGNMGNFIAYAVMGVPAGILLQKYGYKKTALIAIAVGFVGVLIQYLSGHAASFGVYLTGAFVAGFSMCLLNTVVNPMLNTLGGGGNKGNQLIQVGGSFNSVMATFTPAFVGILIGEAAKAKIENVFPVMYIAMGVFALVFFVLWAVSIPEPHAERASEPLGSLMSGAIKFRHFVLGAIGIFVYVGVEVGTPATMNLWLTEYTIEGAQECIVEYKKQQNDPAYLAEVKEADELGKDKSDYITKEIKANEYEKSENIVSGKSKPGMGMNTATSGFVVGTYWFLMLIGRLFGASIGGKVSSKILLMGASSLALVLVSLAIFSPSSFNVMLPVLQKSGTGALSFGLQQVPINAMFLVLIGLCTSIMWGGIYNLAVEGLGKYLAAASGLFMVMVCGGGILPAVQGWVADIAGYMPSYWVMFAGFAYLLYYALIGSKNVNKDIPV